MEVLHGKMIALEGVDGVGKSTAAAALARVLAEGGLDVALHDFPVYEEPRFGPLIGDLLCGDLEVRGARTPQAVALVFAGNRAATRDALRAERDGGRTLLCDRYHLSNAAYQGARVPPGELDAFLEWILDVEIGIFGALRPDVSLWLDVPLELKPDTQTEDVFEADEDLQRRVRDVYARLARSGAVVRVDGTEAGTLLTPEVTAQRLLNAALSALAG